MSNQTDFINSLPPGSMQSFTLMEKSQSTQQDGVNEKWPRVIRFNTTGTLIMAYVCNPASPEYNTVEIIHWDDQADRFVFSHVDYRGKASGIEKHLTENPKLCLQCHDPGKGLAEKPDPRSNWGEYNFWSGAFGADDDVLTGPDLPNYRKFLASQVDSPSGDPCYKALPWPGNRKVSALELYPYSGKEGGADLRLRPNEKLNMTQSLLLAKRIARKFREKPVYQDIDNLILLEAMGCKKEEWLDRKYQEALPSYKAPDVTRRKKSSEISDRPETPTSDTSHAKRMYAAGQVLGFAKSDWTLQPPDSSEELNYSSGVAGNYGKPGHYARNAQDASITQVVQAEILKNEAKTDSRLKPFIQPNHGAEAVFGPDMSCLDDLGGPIFLDPSQTKGLCRVLEKRQKEREKVKKRAEVNASGPAMVLTCATPAAQVLPDSDEAVFSSIANQLLKHSLTDAEKATIGKQVVQASCIHCHSSKGDLPEFYNFFESEGRTKAELRSHPTFVENVRYRLFEAPAGNRMPLDRKLSVPEQEAVYQYIQSLQGDHTSLPMMPTAAPTK